MAVMRHQLLSGLTCKGLAPQLSIERAQSYQNLVLLHLIRICYKCNCVGPFWWIEREAADPSNFSRVPLMPDAYLQSKPELEDYWRGIILFGNNVASYKFALADALLDIKPQSGQLLKLIDLAPVYASKLVQHLKVSPKQITSKSSKYLDSCRLYGIETPDQNKLIDETVKNGFKYVIDAFHVVGQDQLSTRFYTD